MTSIRRSATLVRLSLALLVLGGLGVVEVETAPDARAAVSCTYSGLTSTKVKNVSCSRGAYAALNRANSQPGVASASGTRLGPWVGKGAWSTNTSGACQMYPTMMWG